MVPFSFTPRTRFVERALREGRDTFSSVMIQAVGKALRPPKSALETTHPALVFHWRKTLRRGHLPRDRDHLRLVTVLDFQFFQDLGRPLTWR